MRLHQDGQIFFITFWISIFCFTDLQSQNYSPLLQARQIGLSDNSSLLGGASALYANPAAAGTQDHSWDLMVSADRKFNSDISSFSTAFSKNTSGHNFGLLLGRYGIKGFEENQISISYGRKIGSRSNLGIQGHLYQFRIEGLGKRTDADISVGVWHMFTDQLGFSSYLKNPLAGLRKERKIFGKVEAGLFYVISEKLKLYSSVDQPWGSRISVKPGILYQPYPIVTILASFNSSPAAMSFGLGLDFTNNMKIDIGINTHPILGNSMAFSFGFIIE